MGSARLRALRIQTATAPTRLTARATRAPPPAPPRRPPLPRTAPRRRPACPTLFAPDSVWNAPLAATAPLDPASSVLVKTLRDTVAQNIAAGWGPWISTRRDVAPLHRPRRSAHRAGAARPGLVEGGPAADLRSSPDPTERRAGRRPRRAHDRLAALHGPPVGVLPGAQAGRRMARELRRRDVERRRRSPGYYDTASWPGLSQSWWGATATSLPVIAGTMMIERAQGRRHPARAGDEHPVGEAQDVLVAGAAHRRHQHRSRTRSPRARASVSTQHSTSTRSTCRR